MSMIVYPNRSDIPSGFYITGCAVSGGSLREFLTSAMKLSGGRLCPTLEPVYREFLLPCPTGKGTRITKEYLNTLLTQHAGFFSETLCTNYLTFLRDQKLVLILYDTPESLRKKYRLLHSLSVPCILVPDAEVRQIIKK